MPNWNQNTATFRHADPAQVDRLVDGFVNDRLFGEFFPTPKELSETVEIGEHYNERVAALEAANLEKFGYAGWYDWNIDAWGTKWDVGEEMDSVARIDERTVRLSYDTAWGPPIAFYEKMSEAGWEITAYYLEEGMGFVGKYTSEEGDENFNFDGSEDLEDIPEDICEHWDLAGICELRGDWEDDDADDDFDDDATDPDTESGDGTAPSDEKS